MATVATVGATAYLVYVRLERDKGHTLGCRCYCHVQVIVAVEDETIYMSAESMLGKIKEG